MSESRSPTPTNTRPTASRNTTGDSDSRSTTSEAHELSSLPHPVINPATLDPQPGPSRPSRRRRLSGSSHYERMTKRVRSEQHGPASPSSPSSDSQSGTGDSGGDAAGRQTGSHLPPAPEKKKRTRTLTTPHQAAVLHALLAQSRFPTTAMREEVGRAIGLSARKVQIWFQNQRQKARRPKSQSEESRSIPSQYGPFPNMQGEHGLSSSSSSREFVAGSSGPPLREIDRDVESSQLASYPPIGSYHGSYEAMPLLQGPGMPGHYPAAGSGIREPSPRPSTGQSSYTTGQSTVDVASPTSLFTPGPPPMVQSPTRIRDPSRILPPLVFNNPVREPGAPRPRLPSLSAPPSATSTSFPSAFPQDTPQHQISQSEGSGRGQLIPPPFTLEPQPRWEHSTSYSSLPASSWSSSMSSTSVASPLSPARRRSPSGDHPSPGASDRGSGRALEIRSRRFDPIRGGFIPSPSPPRYDKSPSPSHPSND